MPWLREKLDKSMEQAPTCPDVPETAPATNTTTTSTTVTTTSFYDDSSSISTTHITTTLGLGNYDYDNNMTGVIMGKVGVQFFTDIKRSNFLNSIRPLYESCPDKWKRSKSAYIKKDQCKRINWNV